MRRPRALPKAKRSEASQVLELEPVVRPWPKGKRCACLFTFDLDADVVWVHRGSDDPIALSMGRYESKVGVPLLLNLLDDYGIKSTFFVPGWVAEQYTPTIEDILGVVMTSSITGICTSRLEHSNRRTRRNKH